MALEREAAGLDSGPGEMMERYIIIIIIIIINIINQVPVPQREREEAAGAGRGPAAEHDALQHGGLHDHDAGEAV